MYDWNKSRLVDLFTKLFINYSNKRFYLNFDRFYSILSVLNLLTEFRFKAFGALTKNRIKANYDIHHDLFAKTKYES